MNYQIPKLGGGRFVILPIITIIILTFCFNSCSKPYVGRSVNTNTRYWCQIYSMPATCRLDDSYFIFSFSITRGANPNEYILEGTVDPTRGKLKSWDVMSTQKSQFLLVLANNNIVVDTISFFPVGTDLARPLGFSKKFTCEMQFDAAIIAWKTQVRG